MAGADTPKIDSATWQTGYLTEHVATQTKYLDTVAATGVVQQVAHSAMHLLGLAQGSCVLEMGCGSGVFLPRLAEAVGSAGSVVGVDHSAAFIEQAKARIVDAGLAPVVRLEVADAYALPFENGTFDAAHCERVLMHLEDPNRAIMELARVVRRRGVVVAAEPDWVGVRLDHPDREMFERVFRKAITKHRQPDMGLTLFRRFAEVGLVNCRHLNVSTVIEDFEAWKRFGLDLVAAVDQLALEVDVDRSRLATIVPTFEEASSTGRFYSAGTFHVVSGEVAAN